MTVSRRNPLAKPNLSVPLPPESAPLDEKVKAQTRTLQDIVKALGRLWDSHVSSYNGLPKEHQDTHLAGGSDALQTPGTPASIEPDDAASVGVGPSYAYEDHQHAIVAALAADLSVGQSAGEGVATSFARSDHAHGVPNGTPVGLGTSNQAGSSGDFADAAHVHKQTGTYGVNAVDIATRYRLDIQGTTGGGVDAAGVDDAGGDAVHVQLSVTGHPTTKGDSWTHNGTTQVREAVGANDTVLMADSTQATGRIWQTVAASLFKLLTTKGDLAVSNGSTVVRLPVGTSKLDILEADSNAGEGIGWIGRHLPYIYDDTVADATATDVLTVVLTDSLTSAAGEFHYWVQQANGSEVQTESGVVYYSAYNKSGTLTTSVTEDQKANQTSSGTLTVTFAASTSGTTFKLQMTASSSLGSPSYIVSGFVQATDGNYAPTINLALG